MIPETFVPGRFELRDSRPAFRRRLLLRPRRRWMGTTAIAGRQRCAAASCSGPVVLRTAFIRCHSPSSSSSNSNFSVISASSTLMIPRPRRVKTFNAGVPLCERPMLAARMLSEFSSAAAAA